jgi:hypothetical protein
MGHITEQARSTVVIFRCRRNGNDLIREEEVHVCSKMYPVAFII